MRIAFVTFVVLSCLAGRAAAENIFLDRVCEAEPTGETRSLGDVRDYRGIQHACCDEDGDNPYLSSRVWIIRSPLTVSDSPAATCAADSNTRGWAVDSYVIDGKDFSFGGRMTSVEIGNDQSVEYICPDNELTAVLYDCPCGVTGYPGSCRQQQPTDQPRQVLPGENIPRPELIPQPRTPIQGGVPVPGTPVPLPPRPRTQ